MVDLSLKFCGQIFLRLLHIVPQLNNRVLLGFVTDDLIVATDHLQCTIQLNALLRQFLLKRVNVKSRLTILLLELMQRG